MLTRLGLTAYIEDLDDGGTGEFLYLLQNLQLGDGIPAKFSRRRRPPNSNA